MLRLFAIAVVLLPLASSAGAPDEVDDGIEAEAEVEIELVDSDLDGLFDVDELANGSDPYLPDTDFDGLMDGEEVNQRGTDPANPDTDGDGVRDGVEVMVNGTDPLQG